MPDDIWEANTIRLTLFPVEPIPSSFDAWRTLFDAEPDTEETRAKEGFKRQAGQYGSGAAEVQYTPARLDVIIIPPPAEINPAQPVLPNITFGPIVDRLSEFENLTPEWLMNLPFRINRMAISGNAMIEKDTIQETYEVLKEYIKSVDVKPATMRELLYRINWQRPATLVEYYNNIQFWSSIVFQGQSVVNDQMPPVTMQRKFLAQLQFDVNTPEDRARRLEARELSPIFGEMLALVREALTEGERPL
jgi:hypothetical protein